MGIANVKELMFKHIDNGREYWVSECGLFRIDKMSSKPGFFRVSTVLPDKHNHSSNVEGIKSFQDALIIAQCWLETFINSYTV